MDAPSSANPVWSTRLLIIGALAIAALAHADLAPRSVSYAHRVMGTYAQVVLVTADSSGAAPLAARAHAALSRVDSLMSNWTTTSEVARINREAGRGTVTVEPEVATVIAQSLRTWKDSEGAMDITVEPLVRAWGFLGGPRRVPTDDEVARAFRHVGSQRLRFDAARRTLSFDDDSVKIDLGSIAKGYGVDVAADSLRAAGVRDALVDLSGNMMAMGAPAGATSWRIGIRDPRDRIGYLGIVHLTNRAISTSGKYEQFVVANGKTYGHILDPRTGRPSEGLIAVTVVAPTAMLADAWDTPLFVLGPDAAMRVARAHPEFAAILVKPGAANVDTMLVESSLEPLLTIEPAARPLLVVRTY